MITPLMQLRRLFAALRAGVVLGLLCVLLGFAPFAVAQDIHHELAAADHDGHEHSDNDLCQWVQHQLSGSVDLGGPIFSAWELVSQYEAGPPSILLSAQFASLGPSRAPPLA